MKKIIITFLLLIGSFGFLLGQSTTPISAEKMAAFTVPDDNTSDTLSPYYKYLGIRKITAADADGDGDKEILAIDYTNGGRVHVLEVAGGDSLLEIIWSSPAEEFSSLSGHASPRSVTVGDCDGDGNKEIIFGQSGATNLDGSIGRIVFYQWNGTDWGDNKVFDITPKELDQIGGRENMVFKTEHLTVYDLDNDGRTEIIAGGGSNTDIKDVLILGITFEFNSGFAGINIEGGKPGDQINGFDWEAGGALMSSVPADIDGDGEIEIVNHIFNNFGFWSIDVKGTNTYVYPIATDNTDAKAKGVYHEYSEFDAVSYPGAMPVDVNGDGRDEIVGTMWNQNSDVSMIAFTEADTGVYIWDEASQTENYSVIAPNTTIAGLSDKESVFLWPIVRGDLNKDGKDEIYTGGGQGFDVVALQYNESGTLLDPNSYDINIVDDGEGGDVFGTINIYNGRLLLDTLITGSDTTITQSVNESIIDTIPDESTRPFTASLFADNVDLDGDGNLEIVISGQGIDDSISYKTFNYVDSTGTGSYSLNLLGEENIFNSHRQTIRVLEFNGTAVGFKEKLYGIISPDDYKLEQNYPNPFNPTTTINFNLPIDKKISLKVYDIVGREVKTLIDNFDLKKGNHQVYWDGTNNLGAKVSSGHYIAKLKFGSFAKSIKMTLLK